MNASADTHTARRPDGGWTLIELVVTITVLTILTLGVIPLVQSSIRRHREQQLREALREMRSAIKAFHRDTVGMQCAAGGLGGLGGGTGAGPATPPLPPAAPAPGVQGVPGANVPAVLDPRSKVVISDCTIFGLDNPDHFPPTLETLVEGVNVIPRATLGAAMPGIREGQATDNKLVSTKKKIYLRAVPVDPMTGRAEWDLRSCYDASDSSDWGGENVFDVRSKSAATSLDGKSKYNEW